MARRRGTDSDGRAPGGGQWSAIPGRPRLADRIAAEIQAKIDDEMWEGGTRLPSERDLAAALGVSRPSLREALQLLAARRVVEIRHGAGVFVLDVDPVERLSRDQRLSPSDIREFFDMREVLEAPATAWAAERADDEDLAAIAEAHQRWESAVDAGELSDQELFALDVAFHEAIVSACGNRFMLAGMSTLRRLQVDTMGPTMRKATHLPTTRRAHRRILDAVLARDPDEARQAATDHIRTARRNAEDELAPSTAEA
ncbi:FadR/GntR family transcriptional regulator [Nocardiopsis sp. NPDC050513]|uniref:FadR/GntR family transcriptional regulator n=1 Tax=Nocardiopsis sp. NPDC050513 TaxID=3364338 RepID=UPI0037909004